MPEGSRQMAALPLRLFHGTQTSVRTYRLSCTEAENEIIRAYRTGKRFFKTGGAVGFDTLAAEVVLQLREHLPELALMVIVPFEGQDIYFSPASKVRYRRILDQADEVVVLSATYFQHCYLRRNAYMVNHASRLIAYYDGVGTGGTSFTVRLAESKQIPVSNLFQ